MAEDSFLWLLYYYNLYRMSDKLNRTKDGLYPAAPGFESLKLGDYGYWNDSQWCYCGNICEDFGLVEFSELEDLINEEEISLVQSNLDAGVKAGAKRQGAGLNLAISFDSVGGIFFRAHITRKKRYSAVVNEVFRFLETNVKNGVWNPKYWIAVEINYADSLLSIKSTSKGTKIEFDGTVEEMLHKANANFDAHFKKSSGSFEKLVISDGKEHFAGARFVGMTINRTLFRVRMNVDYQGEATNYLIASEEIEY